MLLPKASIGDYASLADKAGSAQGLK